MKNNIHFFDNVLGAEFRTNNISQYQFSRARKFMEDWYANGSNDLAPARACAFVADADGVTVYASGYYLNRPGLVKIFYKRF